MATYLLVALFVALCVYADTLLLSKFTMYVYYVSGLGLCFIGLSTALSDMSMLIYLIRTDKILTM